MADVRLGSVFINFRARTQEFTRGVQRVSQQVRQQIQVVDRLRRAFDNVGRASRTFGRNITNIYSAFRILAGGRAILQSARRIADFGATLVELELRTGIAVEQIQLLQRVFAADGVQPAQLTRGIERALRNIGDARTGFAIPLGSLLDLGIDPNSLDLQARDFVTQFLTRVSEGIRSLPNDVSTRSQALFNIFGRVGPSLLPVLERGGEDLQRQINLFNEFSTITREQGDALKDLAQTFSNLSITLEAEFGRALASAGVEFERVLDLFIDRAPGIAENLTAVLLGFTQLTRLIIENAPIVVRLLGTVAAAYAVLPLATALGGPLGAGIAIAAGAAGGIGLETLIFGDDPRSAINVVREYAGVLDRIGATFNRLIFEVQGVGSAVGSFFALLNSLIEVTRRLNEELEETDTNLQTFSARLGANAGVGSLIVTNIIQGIRLIRRELEELPEVEAEAFFPADPRNDPVLSDAQTRFALFLDQANVQRDRLREEGDRIDNLLEDQIPGRVADGLRLDFASRTAELLSELRRQGVGITDNTDDNLALLDEVINSLGPAAIFQPGGEGEGTERARVREEFVRLRDAYIEEGRRTASLIGDQAAARRQAAIEALTPNEALDQEELAIRRFRQRQQEELQGIRNRAANRGLSREDRAAEEVRQQLLLQNQRRRLDLAMNLERAEGALALARASESRSEQTRAQRQIDDIQEAIKFVDEQSDGYEALAESARMADLELQELERGEEFDARIVAAAQRVGSAFEDLAVQAITNFDNIGDAARGLARALLQDLLRLLVIRPITNAIAGGIAGAFGVNIDGAAQHGGFHRGITLVGEAGPEIVDFGNTGAQVFSNPQSGALVSNARGGNIVFNFAPNITGDNPEFVRSQIAEAYPIFEAQIRGNILRDISRPSPVQTALRRGGR